MFRHFFECSEHEEGAIAALAEGRLPLKYAYAGSSSETHIQLAESAGYQSVNWQLDGEVAAVRSFNLPASMQVVEFGPGSGDHTANLLRALNLQSRVTRYAGVDFSRSLFLSARPHIRHAAPGLPIFFHCCDLELLRVPLLAEPVPFETLFLVLGGMFANVDDPHRTAVNIRSSLPSGSIGVISIPGYREGVSPGDYVSPYLSKAFRNAALEPLRALGLDEDQADFFVRWDHKTRTVVAGVEILADRDLRPPGMRVTRGQKLHCFMSRRYVAKDFAELLESAGLQGELFRDSPDGTLIWKVMAR